ncbi:MAG: type II secretion system F family protein [Candidatus Coatesbacteria bacterium]|nr:type II secretion system F family protein [Candidatus Coatesbacteria bacterium]
MPVFVYKASDRQGNLTEGTMDAREKTLVAEALRQRDLFPVKIEAYVPKKGLAIELSLKQLTGRIRQRDVLAATHQLATLLEAGVPLDKALAITIDTTERDKFRRVLENVRKNVQGGNSFADALAKYPRVFSRMYVNMVRAGERGGVLESVLKRLVQFLESSQQMREHIISSMIYPLLLVVVGGVAVVVLLMFVIPKFAQIFEDMGQALPLPTQILMTASDTFGSYWWAIVALLIAAAISFKQVLRNERTALSFDQFKLKVPVLGTLLQKIEVARFARTLGTLVRNGVPIIQALKIVKDVITNRVISEAMSRAAMHANGKGTKGRDIISSITKGKGISRPLAESGVFPPLAVSMVTIGEESGQLEDMLEKVAEIYEMDVKNTLKRLIGLLEPMMILVMGLVVGFIVISMLMAVFSINDIPM